MKRILSILLTLLLFSGIAFADETEGDEYIDDYVYEQNGAGDQFLKLNIGAFFPLNFGGSVKNNGGKLYTGGDANVGYYKFVNNWLALGGEITVSYNVSIGHKVLITLPINFGVLMQPTINKFEFPVYLSVGMAYETWQNFDNFPSLSLSASAGAFYRISDPCSVGLSCNYLFIQQWVKGDKEKNGQGQFFGINIGARYHF